MLPFYNDSTMWGPQGDPNQDRPRLKPGDRLADGTVFAGDNPEATLAAALKQVDDKLKPLIARRNEILEKLTELAPEKYGRIILGVEDERVTGQALLDSDEDQPLIEGAGPVNIDPQAKLVEPLEFTEIAAEVDESSHATEAGFGPFIDAPLFTEQVDLPAAELRKDLPPATTLPSVRRPKRTKAK